MTHPTHHVAGFGSRLAAMLIDTLVLFPVAVLLGKLMQFPRTVALLGAVAYGLMYPLYNILLLGWFGQTVGKMVVGIRVELVDASEIKWKSAFLRHAVDLFFAFILIFGWISVLSDPSLDAIVDNLKYYTMLKPKQPFFIWAGRLWTVWIWGELIVMLLNKRRRALHDYIAGTWVVHTRVAEPKVASLS